LIVTKLQSKYGHVYVAIIYVILILFDLFGRLFRYLFFAPDRAHQTKVMFWTIKGATAEKRRAPTSDGAAPGIDTRHDFREQGGLWPAARDMLAPWRRKPQ
jgi:hypothetical protein